MSFEICGLCTTSSPHDPQNFHNHQAQTSRLLARIPSFSQLAIAMASPSSCIVGAVKGIGRPSTLQSALRTSSRRTFATTRNSYAASAWNKSGEKGAPCHLQRQMVYRKDLLSRMRGTSAQPARPFSNSTPRSALKTIEQVKARNKGGPFNVTAAILFIGTAVGLWVYFTYEKERLARKKIADETKGIGKPKVGGPFNLVDQDGKPFSNKDMEGKYALVYFGFTHCPDICPDELDKMSLMYDKTVEKCGNVLLPIMITCDPARDTPAVLKEYLQEFHPDIIGLTGEYENIKQTCKAYRVYFSTPPTVKPGQDYLVDHSIYFYLMDPEGDFVEAIGRNFTADQAAKVITDHIKDWEKPLKKEQRWA
ncbi:SCO1-SenC-domain-containing protein [Aaosphaeria arxii CBS 175.79]|uniref:SCO1-SenC-domain-containing protein n=1 Tax=Aaosphaeria arxii CBS 175.79 TaxID=1450172 RepID=A0A6A5YAA7_9PLEO|nr:SCO1-SenC-domain-containing protein [Aaosphaeria arxii CBS 175.79]KAF2021691.1 SCO1-SenC-domain-containing protein [Aaosphaeria arxii CBS 175.79]